MCGEYVSARVCVIVVIDRVGDSDWYDCSDFAGGGLVGIRRPPGWVGDAAGCRGPAGLSGARPGR